MHTPSSTQIDALRTLLDQLDFAGIISNDQRARFILATDFLQDDARPTVTVQSQQTEHNSRKSIGAPIDNPPHLLDIQGISARTGHTPNRIRQLRVKGHPLYSQAWKNGDAPNSPLLLEESTVDAWCAAQSAKTRRA
ncbi:hypothetical protein JGU71_14030 [Antrihabitans sp. YC3-6]|uniref:Uncharacterized protein n=1 Tax=Antrihabitans stalagmiti TaxID=2799499 RepID=A0A934NRC4_9NOCA|nr:hypothetical protein [Antrihabitans stalagmiti]MBJ8340011.1 hypothetical protein [Antrihabitans stalagmiti]